MGLISVSGSSLKQRIAERSDPTSSALRHIVGREVEQEKNYNAPQFRGSTNPQQSLSAADHTHGTPDGTIGLLAAQITASVRDAPTPVYIPDGWENHPLLIRGCLTEWELSCYPPGAELSFHLHFPGFIDGTRIIPEYDFDITRATDGSWGDIPGGVVSSVAEFDQTTGIGTGQNTTDHTKCDVLLTMNGSGDGDESRAQGCTLNLHGHRNRSYAFILLPQIDHDDPDNPDDIPEE